MAEHARETLRLLRGELERRPPSSRAGLVQGLEILSHTDLRRELPQLRCPTHWLLGTRDTLVPRSLPGQLSVSLPNASIDQIEGAGHAPFLSHPEATLQALLGAMDVV